MNDLQLDRSSSHLVATVQDLLDSGSIRFPLRLGVTGHRTLDESVEQWVARELGALFRYLAHAASGVEAPRAVSSLAVGADQLFATAALHHGVPFDVVLPFSSFIEDFPEGPDRYSYEHLLSAAKSVTCLPWDSRSNGAYLAGGLWVVDHCDILIAIWNGEKAAGVGGTGDIVDYCRDTGKPCIHLNTTTLRIEMVN
jgi:hypothetical protein